MWSVISYVAGLTLEDFLFMPVVFTPAYRSAAIFFESQVTDVGTLFTPLMGLIGVIGAIVLVALAPSLREEISPGRGRAVRVVDRAARAMVDAALAACSATCSAASCRCWRS